MLTLSQVTTTLRTFDSVPFESLVGQTFKKVEGKVGGLEVVFETVTGTFVLKHYQNCCEEVYIQDICGDLTDLVDSPILYAEMAVNNPDQIPDNSPLEEVGCHCTWTFYKIGTIKGSVTIRWFGQSNGYYSEEVECYYYNSEFMEPDVDYKLLQ
jgi:hypothetical protein